MIVPKFGIFPRGIFLRQTLSRFSRVSLLDTVENRFAPDSKMCARGNIPDFGTGSIQSSGQLRCNRQTCRGVYIVEGIAVDFVAFEHEMRSRAQHVIQRG